MIELVSIHIPKTAGRSFLAILKSVYDESTIAHFDRKNYTDKNIPDTEQFKLKLNDKIKIIHGHFQYKDIEDLPKIENAKVITWVRNPVERVISNFSFFKKRIQSGKEEKRKDESLLEYAKLENSRNRMKIFMAGLPLNNFYFVGITERFDKDVVRLGKMLEWKPFDVPRINDNTEYKSTLPEATQKDRRIIADLNKEDMELYKAILESTNKISG